MRNYLGLNFFPKIPIQYVLYNDFQYIWVLGFYCYIIRMYLYRSDVPHFSPMTCIKKSVLLFKINKRLYNKNIDTYIIHTYYTNNIYAKNFYARIKQRECLLQVQPVVIVIVVCSTIYIKWKFCDWASYKFLIHCSTADYKFINIKYAWA